MTEPTRPTKYICSRCGACCRWPGDVRLGDDEIDELAAYLGLDTDTFLVRFTRVTADRRGLSLTETEDGACIFLTSGNLCKIHPVKPRQCRAFPSHWNFPGFEKLCKARPQ